MQLCICAPNKTAPDHIQNFSGTVQLSCTWYQLLCAEISKEQTLVLNLTPDISCFYTRILKDLSKNKKSKDVTPAH